MKEGFSLSLSFFPKVQTEPHQNIITWRYLNPSVNIAKSFMKDLIELSCVDTHTHTKLIHIKFQLISNKVKEAVY